MSNDRDFAFWEKIYEKKQESLFWFLFGLKFKDRYYLTNEKETNSVDDFVNTFSYGFIEKDFQSVFLNENPKKSNIRNKIAVMILENINLNPIKKKFGTDAFYQIIEDVIISGSYESLGISSELLISKAVENKYLDIHEVPFVAILRGTILKSREDLKKNNFFNKLFFKVFFKKNRH